MVSEHCYKPPVSVEGDVSPSPLPCKGDFSLLLVPSKGDVPPLPFPNKGCEELPPSAAPRKRGAPPPPPPGLILRSNSAKKSTAKLKRSSNMGSLYKQLREKMEGSFLGGKQSQVSKKGAGSNGGASGGQSMADTLAELAKRSPHYRQIEEDVIIYENQIKEMQAALISFQTKDMDTLLKFYQQVETLLNVLTDENKVLARFEGFPMKKLEALRMAAVLFRKLSGVLSELQNWKFEPPLAQLLNRVEKYFDKIRRQMEDLERTKDDEEKKFQRQNIYFDFSILVKIKEAVVDVSSNCIELALKERTEAKAAANVHLLSKAVSHQKTVSTELLWRTFQLAYRVYNFTGGQDERADSLKDKLAKEIELDLMKD